MKFNKRIKQMRNFKTRKQGSAGCPLLARRDRGQRQRIWLLAKNLRLEYELKPELLWAPMLQIFSDGP
ncbi:MAG: hypothetical protein K2R98_20710 [Gemmataceae bacterium]|nr:hypothetical protein [Gemmataceae bacterium]